MSNQITIYSSDFQSINYNTYIIEPSPDVQLNVPSLRNISIDIVCPDKSDKILEFPYVIYQNHFFSFKKSLKCKLTQKKNLYYLNNDELNIAVWGSSQDEVIEAFNFQFHSLYRNFALENDENLSTKAQILKSKILALISLVL